MTRTIVFLAIAFTACSLERTNPVVTSDEVDLSTYPQQTSLAAAVDVFETQSSALTDIPGGELQFVPKAGETWMLLFSARLSSSSTSDRSVEIAYSVDDTPRGIGGTQSRSAYSAGPWQHFDWLTGAGVPVHVRTQLRSLNNASVRVEALSIVAFRVPGEMHAIAVDQDQLIPGTTYVEAAQLAFTPSAPGDYLLLGLANGRESPGQSDIFVRWRSPTNTLWGGFYQNPRACNQSFFVAHAVTLDATPQTFTTEVLGSDTGDGATVSFARLVAIRLDAFDATFTQVAFDLVVSSDTPEVVTEVITAPTDSPHRHIVIQNMSPDSPCGSDDGVIAPSFLRDGVTTSVFAHAVASCAYQTSYGDVRLVESADAFVVSNALAAAPTVLRLRDSVIHVLRLRF